MADVRSGKVDDDHVRMDEVVDESMTPELRPAWWVVANARQSPEDGGMVVATLLDHWQWPAVIRICYRRGGCVELLPLAGRSLTLPRDWAWIEGVVYQAHWFAPRQREPAPVVTEAVS